jgi:hypothetical protein
MSAVPLSGSLLLLVLSNVCASTQNAGGDTRARPFMLFDVKSLEV